ncbi:MAG: heme exporter protein [Variibacter sp.]|jgi:heme exporter protein D|nr:heme exporter protein [Variibacter sp.]
MQLGPHASFILAAYAVAGIIVLGLIAWAMTDYRTQQRQLAELEQRGVSRRSVRSGK